jgi:hypothetical protein
MKNLYDDLAELIGIANAAGRGRLDSDEWESEDLDTYLSDLETILRRHTQRKSK